MSIILKLLICITAMTLPRQDFGAGTKPNLSATEVVHFSGIVTKRRKYSVDVVMGTKNQTIRVKPTTQIVLRMIKPWFDWDNRRVIVDTTSTNSEPKATGRYAIRLPEGDLHLFCRFANRSHAEFVMADPVKRINNYLISPQRFQDLIPTRKQPVLSGTLISEMTDGPVELKVNQTHLPIILGFRNASMEGFTISELVPGRVRVTVTGSVNARDEVVAKRIVFRPITLPGSDSINARQPATK